VKAAERRPGRLRDVVAPGLRVLLVGINPGLRSAEVGHHFAGRGNPFWRLLHAAGLTPVAVAPEEDARLPELGLGVTNVCPRATRSAAELSPAELREGVRALREKIVSLRPRVVALVGVSLYRIVVPGGREPGPGAKRAGLLGARMFVLPNPSGRNAAYPGFEEKLVWFRRLARFLGDAPGTRKRRRPSAAGAGGGGRAATRPRSPVRAEARRRGGANNA
jgi:double-stranded uracil-DNA glycosylase